jgi:uncharacterized protein (DUF488 family)
MARLLTVGHGTLERDAMVELLAGAGVTTVVDVRRYPGSRRHPQFASDTMAEWLPPHGIDYRWDERLGGRRRLEASEAESDQWWQVEAFRAYAAHTRTPEFRAGIEALLAVVRRQGTTTVMCSESLWWRCHRRLVADVAVLLHDLEVWHLSHAGKLSPHAVSAGARVAADGLRYDLGDGDS